MSASSYGNERLIIAIKKALCQFNPVHYFTKNLAKIEFNIVKFMSV